MAEIAREVILRMTSRGMTLASCESITGGGIGWVLTGIPGSSAVYRGGLITYATALKCSLAGVDAHYVAQHGVINEETARQMAAGARRVCSADVGVATTGTAGPEGQDGVAPGSVWICVETQGGAEAFHLQLHGGREAIRNAVTRYALDAVLRNLGEG